MKTKQSPLGLPGTVTENSLVLPAKLSFEEWESTGKVLLQILDSHQWWVGDWWAFGQHGYGERAAQAVDGKVFGTLMNLGSVSRAFSETSPRGEVVPSGINSRSASDVLIRLR